MTKTARDVVHRALELIGVKPVGESAEDEDFSLGSDTYTAILEELSDRDGMAFEWTRDTTPEWAFMPLAGMVAARIAPVYGVAFEGREYYRILRRHVFRDDRVPGQAVDGRYY